VRALVIVALLAAAATAVGDPAKFKLDGNKLVLPGTVVYDTGKATLKADSEPSLAHVKAYLDARKQVTKLRIEVHSDSQGSDEYNQKMSELRALATAKALVGMGVDCKRLVPVGFGETRPIASNKTAAGRAQNRRTDFVNAELKGKPIKDTAIDGGGVVAGDPCADDL
jgi:OOP family OmpA-OmpF porin